MNRKVILAKDAILWEIGEPARNIAVLEKGKLGVRIGNQLIGVVLPKMILGETALLDTGGQPPSRTATIFAMEDDTLVVEYPPSLVRKMFEVEDKAVALMILKNLVGQVGKHCLLVYNANREHPIIREAMRECLRGLIGPARDLHNVEMESWDGFLHTFQFLCTLRDFLSDLTQRYLTRTSDRAELIDRSSAMVREMLSEQDTDLAQVMMDFIHAERQRGEWFVP